MEEFFPPGVLEKGELAPESVKTGTVLCTTLETFIMLLHLTIQFTLYYLSSGRSCEVKKNPLGLKVVEVAY